ncbi:MAG: hypothetical protein AVDCRST_MAG75-2982 [uncultured Propionibacteriaceae bacterium]|uniref:Uncharacterized protein n=1 Tax=uncultured Propionibacteriaceae bacterium TaxID=257457 RepID=A0A6J4PHZ1_9ACTN|nr:MAG: hypothetical protein AVDCRST_MAG75-2982 [uncultured Propionibacteriaceae bacterium]
MLEQHVVNLRGHPGCKPGVMGHVQFARQRGDVRIGTVELPDEPARCHGVYGSHHPGIPAI